MNNKQPWFSRLKALAGDKRFFYAVAALLVLQAAWIALSGRYPMAFDEDFHLGIIRLYAHHINPFWNNLPDGTDALGAVTRDPSYLYHYLMSFPYRLIELFTHNQAAQVLILRALNIGLFAWGLALYRRLLAKTGASPALANLSLLVFVLVPITPMLAAQINYDNLLLPLTALALLTALSLCRDLDGGKPAININRLLALISLCLLTSLVKYAFLPVSLALAGWLAYCIGRRVRLADMGAMLKAGVKNTSKSGLIALCLLTVVSAGLFIERYGVNLARYHKPVVDCAKVLNYEHCRYYGPWIRDYNFSQTKGPVDTGPLVYGQHWFYGMWLRSFFAVDGPGSDFQTRGPLTMPGLGAAVLAGIGGLAFAVKARRLWQKYDSAALSLMAVSTVLYIAVLWLEEYRLFKETGQPVAINGRYLLPVLPFLILAAALAVNEIIKRRPRMQIAAAGLVLLCFIWGGGALTYILRSNDAWYWDNSAVRSANHAVQRVIGPVTPGYGLPTEYMH